MLLKVEEYKTYLKDGEKADNTIRDYVTTLKQLEDYLNFHQITEITKTVMTDYKEYLTMLEFQKGDTKKNYEISSINQTITKLNVYFNWIYNVDDGGKNPLSLKQHNTQIKAHRKSIDDTDYKRMLKNAHSRETYQFMLVIANTGMRITEVLKLKVSDLDKKIIRISNKGKFKTVSLPLWLRRELKKYVIDALWGNEDSFIFPKSKTSYRNYIKKTAGKAKVNSEKAYPHSFRHYFAKQYILKHNGNISDLQQLLGHSNIQTTAIYTHLSVEELAAIQRKVKNI
ncbi:tyrosine-type recombinase/integrase [Vagococcus salmoninarum]|uniref:Integrase n=1 Tax=Vagococcus salmoninarum TaxID=2739 RepID=A0A429ZSD3_9ENTE|nr:site-specific integrase [Vagococcus salmoninarum]RST96632.1 hypothetical protein CBF35_05210 [Vagococcus salmoninarum]